MAALLIAGVGLFLASIALAVARDFVIKHVTSKSLGSLAPGYAATRQGYYTYVALVGTIGVILQALALSNVWLLLAAIALFVIGSVKVLAGEVVTYRALKR